MNRQPIYYAAFFTTTFTSMDEVRTRAPEALAEHLARSKQLAAEGVLIMAGAFLDHLGEPVSTMGILTSREAAEAYGAGDPFVRNGLVSEWHVRPWANILD